MIKKACLFILLMLIVPSASAMNTERFANASDNSVENGSIIYGVNALMDTKDAKDKFVMIYVDIGKEDTSVPLMMLHFIGNGFTPQTMAIRTDERAYNISAGSTMPFLTTVDGSITLLVNEDISKMIRDMSTSQKTTIMTFADGNSYEFALTDKQKVQLSLMADEYEEEIAPSITVDNPTCCLFYKIGKANVVSSKR